MKKFLFSLAVVLLSCGVVFIGAEILVRVLSKSHFKTPAQIRKESLHYDSAIFARHVISEKEMIAAGWKGASWRINAKGYRGPDFSTTKASNIKRLMFYGGSAVFDPRANRALDWPRQVEHGLHKLGFGDVEVINAGVPDHASFDSLGRLHTEGHLFQPDFVILENAWNDFKVFHQAKPLLRHLEPAPLEKDPRISYHNSADKILCRVSEVYRQIRGRYYERKYGSEGQKFINDKKIQPEALAQYKLTLELFADLAHNIGATPVFILQPRMIDVDFEGELLPFDQKKTAEAYELTDQIMRGVAARKKVHLINASKFMTGKPEYFSDHVHLSEKGSETMAQIVSQNLIQIFNLKNAKPVLVE